MPPTRRAATSEALGWNGLEGAGWDLREAGSAVRCSFCAKEQHEVVRLVAGPGVYIYNEYVGLCSEIISEEMTKRGARDTVARRKARRDDPPALRAWDGLSDDELLAEMVRAHAAHENVDRAVAHHIAALRGRGVTWARIGDSLGMTRQSAWERFSGEE
jgi:hypothetical protein